MNDRQDAQPTHCGTIALVGRPNAGKSTLLNALLGQKISIVTRKPQTTRHRVLGVRTDDNDQFVFVDTPGLHVSHKTALNRHMNRTALKSLSDVDLVAVLVDVSRWTSDDDWVFEQLKNVSTPVVLVLNKIDKLDDPARLLPTIESLNKRHPFVATVPISARRGKQLDGLLAEFRKHLPEGAWMFPEDQVTDRSLRFMASEIVREKLMEALGQELPYVTAVEIESYEDEPGLASIGAVIWVERPSQKAIVIGKQGRVLKRVGLLARQDLEGLVEKRVFLRLWVKVREGWSDDERALVSLGLDDL